MMTCIYIHRKMLPSGKSSIKLRCEPIPVYWEIRCFVSTYMLDHYHPYVPRSISTFKRPIHKESPKFYLSRRHTEKNFCLDIQYTDAKKDPLSECKTYNLKKTYRLRWATYFLYISSKTFLFILLCFFLLIRSEL